MKPMNTNDELNIEELEKLILENKDLLDFLNDYDKETDKTERPD